MKTLTSFICACLVVIFEGCSEDTTASPLSSSVMQGLDAEVPLRQTRDIVTVLIQSPNDSEDATSNTPPVHYEADVPTESSNAFIGASCSWCGCFAPRLSYLVVRFGGFATPHKCVIDTGSTLIWIKKGLLQPQCLEQGERSGVRQCAQYAVGVKECGEVVELSALLGGPSDIGAPAYSSTMGQKIVVPVIVADEGDDPESCIVGASEDGPLMAALAESTTRGIALLATHEPNDGFQFWKLQAHDSQAQQFEDQVHSEDMAHHEDLTHSERASFNQLCGGDTSSKVSYFQPKKYQVFDLWLNSPWSWSLRVSRVELVDLNGSSIFWWSYDQLMELTNGTDLPLVYDTGSIELELPGFLYHKVERFFSDKFSIKSLKSRLSLEICELLRPSSSSPVIKLSISGSATDIVLRLEDLVHFKDCGPCEMKVRNFKHSGIILSDRILFNHRLVTFDAKNRQLGTCVDADGPLGT